MKRILFFLIVLTYISCIPCLYAQTTRDIQKLSDEIDSKTTQNIQESSEKVDGKITQDIQELPIDSSHEKAKRILEKADMSRSPWPKFVMKAFIDYERRGKMIEDVYRVYVKDYNKSLVGYLPPSNRRGTCC